jgi:peptide/nickel transport system permease protein
MALPTTGPVLLSSLMSQDMYLAGTIIMLLSVLTVIGTLISDILLALLDPRIRFQ